MKNVKNFLLLPLLLIFSFSISCLKAQEIQADKTKKISLGIVALFSYSEYVNNYNPSGSLGINIKFYNSHSKKINWESGLYFSSRTLFTSKNYSNLPCDKPELCDQAIYKLHTVTLLCSEMPIIFNYALYKSPKKVDFNLSCGVLNSFKFGTYNKFTREFTTSQKYGTIQINSKGTYSNGVISPRSIYDASLLLGVGLDLHEKCFIGLVAQKGFIKLDQFIKEEHGGNFNALSIKLTYTF